MELKAELEIWNARLLWLSFHCSSTPLPNALIEHDWIMFDRRRVEIDRTKPPFTLLYGCGDRIAFYRGRINGLKPPLLWKHNRLIRLTFRRLCWLRGSRGTVCRCRIRIHRRFHHLRSNLPGLYGWIMARGSADFAARYELSLAAAIIVTNPIPATFAANRHNGAER